MDVIYGLIPGMIFLGVIAVAILFWAAKSGQFEDMEGEAHRILMDDDPSPDFDKPETSATPEDSVESGDEKKG